MRDVSLHNIYIYRESERDTWIDRERDRMIETDRERNDQKIR